MEPPTPSVREQGLQALQQGDLDKAIDLLARAVMADDQDADAKALLGVAYSQKGLHAQAKRALQTATELQPQNPNFRFNLGVVLERAGDAAGAAAAYRETLQLNPQHGQAKARLTGLGPQAGMAPGVPPAAPPGTPPGSPPGQPAYPGAAPPPPGAYVPPPPPGAPQGQGGYSQPPMGGQGAPGGAQYAPPPPPGSPVSGAPGGYGPPPPGAPLGGGYAPPGGPPSGPPGMGGMPGGGLDAPQGPPGTVQCGRCGQFSRAGMSCEFCAAPLAPPRTASASVPAPMPSAGMAPAAGFGQAPVEDEFNLVDGYKDWLRTLISPKSFFNEQTAYEGIKGPASFLLAYAIVYALVSTVAAAMTPGANHTAPGMVGVICGAVCLGAFLFGFFFIPAGILHMACRMFGGQGSYLSTYRATVYGLGPSLAVGIIVGMLSPFLFPRPATPVTRSAVQVSDTRQAGMMAFQTGPGFPGAPGGPGFPGAPGTSAPSPRPGATRPQLSPEVMSRMMGALVPILLFSLVGWIWSQVVTAIGVSELHGMSTGAAIGAVLVANLIDLVILVVIGFLLSAVIVSFAAAVMGGMHR